MLRPGLVCLVDLDAYVAVHRPEWQRLEVLLARAGRPRRLSGGEVDEVVDLYQRVATHLSVVQSTGHDPQLVARLSTLVARARGTVAGGRAASLRDVARFLTRDFPAVCYRTRWWWGGAALGFLVVAVACGFWVAADPQVQSAIADPEQVRQLVEEDFEGYYSAAPAQDFAAQVFTNNAYVAAQAVLFGVLLGIPIPLILLTNAFNVGVSGGLMAANGRTGLFFGLILPHGLLELTAVFVACGLGLKLGWTVIDPGRRTRSAALAQEGRALVVGALGLALVLFVSGLIEGFVTPSGLPTWARLVIGAVAEAAFLAWVFGPGRRAHRAGVTGDIGARPGRRRAARRLTGTGPYRRDGPLQAGPGASRVDGPGDLLCRRPLAMRCGRSSEAMRPRPRPRLSSLSDGAGRLLPGGGQLRDARHAPDGASRSPRRDDGGAIGDHPQQVQQAEDDAEHGPAGHPGLECRIGAPSARATGGVPTVRRRAAAPRCVRPTPAGAGRTGHPRSGTRTIW